MSNTQRARLNRLAAMIQENHTRIQRLWKQIRDEELVVPVAIAAPPSIEDHLSSSSTSSSQSSSSGHDPNCICGGPEVLPSEIHWTVSIPSIGYSESGTAGKTSDYAYVWEIEGQPSPFVPNWQIVFGCNSTAIGGSVNFFFPPAGGGTCVFINDVEWNCSPLHFYGRTDDCTPWGPYSNLILEVTE
jgi:hypothetical protein